MNVRSWQHEVAWDSEQPGVVSLPRAQGWNQMPFQVSKGIYDPQVTLRLRVGLDLG